ncbi:ATP-binding protein [Helicobacter sp. MIT 21-1697]|uniref:ATP-binding protein n=1 Tax=Helicobacter sp. MIT 21-1697 TaxID=2993733 RepID=UPI00224A49FB|nr:ATP-binding protein [Helicobacter sp. MIT 21-1697]MCX2717647.1 ATP-binding protein [Helicobacter sp. MIT 21-1697]
MLPKLFDFSWEEHLACVYRPAFENLNGYFKPIVDFKRCTQLIGLEKEISALKNNTFAFMRGEKASHALLWGARGCGKSSSIHFVLSHLLSPTSLLRIIEINKESLGIMPMVQDCVRELPYKFIIVCDDLCFTPYEEHYKSLKTLLEGSFENKAHNILFYTTSNHRHLITESYPQDTLHLNDAQDEILSLSDRFGLVLGFYAPSRAEFIEILKTLLDKPFDESLKQKALQFSAIKGSCSPRIAQEFCTLYRNGIV